MGACEKLNSAYIGGALLTAAFVGYWFGSWFIFLLVAGALLALCVSDGSIRPSGRPSSRRR